MTRFPSAALWVALLGFGAFGCGGAIACTPPPADQAERYQARDLQAVTVIYRARIENVTLRDPYGDNLSFTLMPGEKLWGGLLPGALDLEFTAGACTNWFFIGEEEADPSPEGLDVIVLANPAGLADHRWLYILRADADYAAFFLDRWREVSGHDLDAELP